MNVERAFEALIPYLEITEDDDFQSSYKPKENFKVFLSMPFGITVQIEIFSKTHNFLDCVYLNGEGIQIYPLIDAFNARFTVQYSVTENCMTVGSKQIPEL